MTIGSRFLAIALLAAASSRAQVAQPVRWACIGNSITQGPSATDAYPYKLGKLLGPGFVVENDGSSGRTLLKAGDFSYWTQGKLSNVFAFKPDIITIKLGTNDSKPINWDTHKGEFERDYLALIDTLSAMPQKPRIFICLPVPAFSDGTGPTGIRGSVLKNEIMPLVKQIAAERGLPVIDLYTPMLTHQAFFADNVHPNAEGHDSLAAFIYRAFMAKSTRLACIGNSITQYAFGTPGTDPKDAYPIKLGELLGSGYYAVNYGRSGAYMQKVSPSPYWNTGLLKKVLDFKPDVVTIKLGTNDSRAQYWHADKYIADYESFIDTLNTLNPKPKIYLLTPIPAWQRNGAWPFNGINDSIISMQTIPALRQVAKAKGLPVFDLYTPMKSQEALVADGVHPNAEGQDSLAHFIYRAMTATVSLNGPAPARAALRPEIALGQGILRVRLPGGEAGVARLYTMDGRLLASARLEAGGTASLSVAGLGQGLAILAVDAAGSGLRAVSPIAL